MTQSGTVHGETGDDLDLTVDRIGGIDRCRVSFDTGVTVLEGRNATNRTSLLTAIRDVLGGSRASIKTDADAGKIEMRIADGTYRRTYQRENGSLTSKGEHFTDERAMMDLFVSLLEDNPIRRAVERGGDLQPLLLEPVDTDHIESRLNELERERADLEARIERIEAEKRRLPELESRRQDIEEELANLNERIDKTNADIDEYEASEEEVEQAEALLDELKEERNRLRDLDADLDRQKHTLEQLEAEHSRLETELSELTVPEAKLDTIDDQLDSLADRKEALDQRIMNLQQIVRFNDELMDGTPDTFAESSDDVTAELRPDASDIVCWTCGRTVDRGTIDERLDELRSIIEENRERRRNVEADISDLEDTKRELGRAIREEERLEQDLENTIEEIEVREEKRESLKEERAEIAETIEEIDARVEETDELRESALVEAYQSLSELEYERGQLEQDLSSVQEEISQLENREEGRLEAVDRIDEIQDEMDHLRSRIANLEREVVDQFNEHMESLLDELAFDNIARIWIERKVSGDADAEFELHIVRERTDGTVYEDTIDTLSESEREVIGLVVALTGYLAHEAYRTAPVMLLDSLEAIDANRIDTLVEYFAEYTSFLIVALLPEDASTVSAEYDRIHSEQLQT